MAVEKIFIHEDFGFNPNPSYSIRNDIAVLKLKSPVDVEARVKLSFPNQYFPTGMPSISIGWGQNSSEGPPQEILQKVTLQIISRQDCVKMYAGVGIEPNSNNICAGIDGQGFFVDFSSFPWLISV